MSSLGSLTKRGLKLFFKDKGMFFTSLITPIILLVLYATFLAKVYRDSFSSALPAGFSIKQKLLDATVGGELFSSLLAVSCVTVSFCCNMLMVQDKVSGARHDITVSPVKSSVLSLSYYISTLISTLLVCLAATAACFIYLSTIGWYMSLKDVMFIILDVFLLTLFGTALSSAINVFLSSQGQISAVGTVVSAGYGFICGAYMPISQFGKGLQRFIMFLPGTYGTSLLRNHAMNGVFYEMKNTGFPNEVLSAIKDSVDCNLYFFDNKVSVGAMYAVLIGSTLLLILLYVLISALTVRKNR
ncbi:MAG TPA: ABC transporter [Ruminococcaceae bacterium]|nr:ABC transporter [Oscillospiraceae bacterium]